MGPANAISLHLLQTLRLQAQTLMHNRRQFLMGSAATLGVHDEEDNYRNLNGGRGTSGQVDLPPPPTEPEMTTSR
jgi:hypothetical protein